MQVASAVQNVERLTGHRPNAPQGAAWWSPSAHSTTSSAAEQDSEGRAAFVALVIFTLILLLAPQNWIPVLGKLRIAFLAGGAAIVCLLWEWWRHRKQLSLTGEIFLCCGLAAWTFLTMPLSYWPGGSMSVLINLYLKALVIFCLVAGVVTTAQRLRFIATTLVLCTLPLAVTALKNYITGSFIAGGGPSLERIAGYESPLGSNPNDLALMLNLLIPLSIALFLSATRPWFAIFCIGVIAINVLGVILTFSRAGFLGLATIGVMYFVKLVRRRADRKWAFVVLALTVMSLPLLPSGYIHRIATITDIDADPTGSAQQRWQGNVAATRFIMGHPIVGAGIGMSILALNDAGGPRWHAVHNVYLEYAVDLGLPGLALFLLLFYRVFTAARSSRRRAASLPEAGDLFFLDEGVEVSLIVFAVAALFHPVAYHFYFYYIAGLAVAARSATDLAIRSKLGDNVHHEPEVLHTRRDFRRLI